MPGSIILLNGASSAGKSTIARAIQEAADGPILRLSLDLFFFGSVLPPMRDGRFDWGPMKQRLLAGYYPSLSAFARAGNDLVVDHVFESQIDYDGMMAVLEGLDVFLVGVHCPLEELERRELARGDRRIGDARIDVETVHSFCDYDLDVDGTLPPAVNAQRILQAWANR